MNIQIQSKFIVSNKKYVYIMVRSIYREYFSYSVQAGYFRVKIILKKEGQKLLGYYGNYIYHFEKEEIKGIHSNVPDW